MGGCVPQGNPWGVIPAPQTVIPGGPYCHSRPPLPSFPRKRESRTVMPKTGILTIGHFWIPAYAGMTVVGPPRPFIL